MIKPGKRDVKHLMLITGQELTSLQVLTFYMSECFGLDRRISKYQGKRPIGLYQWDLDCLIGAIEMGIKDRNVSMKMRHSLVKNYCSVQTSWSLFPPFGREFFEA